MAKKRARDLLTPAGLFIGIGVGLALDQVAAGTLIGLGVGLFAAFVAAKVGKK